VDITFSAAGPYVFSPFGVIISPAGPITIDVKNGSLSTADSRDLRVVIGVGGSVRMCDPKVTYTTGYDITRKEITMTSVGFARDLHCWDMSLQWIPTGYLKSWMFTIKVKASVLQDLKYDRRKDFRDQY